MVEKKSVISPTIITILKWIIGILTMIVNSTNSTEIAVREEFEEEVGALSKLLKIR
jgi:hypothetical protein|nr:MAG: hypothetical protein [Microviridae sp.]WAE43945.1 MAG: hypothetical protein [Microviridae sp.]